VSQIDDPGSAGLSRACQTEPLESGVCVVTLRERVEAEPYWFMRMDLGNGIVTPGWSDVAHDKLPWFGLPEDMTGFRVLDVGSAEGFFSFEAERRGASEVISLDFDPEVVKRFALCAEVLGSPLRARVMSIYDLDPAQLGTFDVVMCFGLLYHLRDPLGGMQRLAAMASGMVLVQSFTIGTSTMSDVPLARLRPHGLTSGPDEAPIFDPTVFWEPNAACISAMLDHVGLVDIEQLPGPSPTNRERLVRRLRPHRYTIWNESAQFRARVSEPSPGRRGELWP
jgi:tRNA (mo5U34)-methyltransferase